MTVGVYCCILFIFTVIAILVIGALFCDDCPLGATVAAIFAVASIIVFIDKTPSYYEMQITEYQSVLEHPPSCMKHSPDDIACLHEYKAWVADSIDKAYKLDSLAHVRDSIKDYINSLREANQ